MKENIIRTVPAPGGMPSAARRAAEAELGGQLDSRYRQICRRADRRHYALAAALFLLLLVPVVRLTAQRFPYRMNVGPGVDRTAACASADQMIATL